jgi:DNA adenine methylase
MTTVRPFLKWVGGKGQLLPELDRRVPLQFARYHEPFLGGGAFFFHLWSSGRIRGGVVSDYNPDLVSCYRTVRDHPQELIDALLEHKAKAADADYFYEVRAWDRCVDFPQRSAVEKAARTIFLNRTCFNGLYRLNSSGAFNTPFGRYKNPLIVDVANMHAVSQALQSVDIQLGDFSDVLNRAESGDFVYFDPPYVPVSATSSFTGYTGKGFDEAQQRRLADVATQLAQRGCYVMLSNSLTDLTCEIYGTSARIDTVQARRSINADGAKRGAVSEIIACSY